MFAEMVEQMAVMELDHAQLEQLISLTDKGDLATIGNLIAERAPDDVRDMFGDAAGHVSYRGHVMPVDDLRDPDLRRLAREVLERSDPSQRAVAIGLGEFSPRQLIDEIERGSVMGTQFVESIRLDSMFIEMAVRNGKIRPKWLSSQFTYS